MAKKSRAKTNAPKPYVVAELPKSLWQQPLTANFRDFFKALGRGVANLATGKKEDLISNAVEATAALGINTPPEQLAGRLVERALKRALVPLSEEAADLFPEGKTKSTASDDEAERIQRSFEEEEIQLNPDFFRRPAQAPIVTRMQKVLEQWLLAIGIPQPNARGLSGRFPGYFAFAIQEEWVKHASVYGPLRTAIDSPFVDSANRETLWNLYSAWLLRQADQRMFNETFGIRQIYIRPRAAFERQTPKDSPEEQPTANPDKKKVR